MKTIDETKNCLHCNCCFFSHYTNNV